MDIHEYQAKKILSDFGIHIPRGGIAYSPENAEYKAREIGGSKWVVKAQIHSGARGKAGGIIICNDELEVAQSIFLFKLLFRFYLFIYLVTIFSAIRAEAASINLPSSCAAPLPSFAAFSNSSKILWALCNFG